MTYREDFDGHAATWDDDPVKVTRAAAVAEGIRSRVPLSRAMRALEYGCGTGLLSFELRHELGHITLADRSTGMLDVLNEKIRAAEASNMLPIALDLVADPLPDERYDLIYTLMTFHHIEDTDAMLRAMSKLLNSHGVLCVADLDAEDGSFHGPGFTGHNGFDRDDLGRRARDAGFRNVDFSTVFHMTDADSTGQTDFPIFLMVARK
jgi:2-polyprenyl-3-methyl-5-hydroxy-6-metoxy-1,4-benzoquinol methylase